MAQPRKRAASTDPATTLTSSSQLQGQNEETTLWSQICSDLNALDQTRHSAESRVAKCNSFNVKLIDKPESLDTKRKKREKPKPAGSPMIKRQKTDDADTSDILRPGDQVAVKPMNSDWLLAIVLKFIAEKNKYEVEDAEDDEEKPGTRKKYIFPAKMVIPIPKETKPRTEFPPGHEVLAQYPASSCFYKATVIVPPSKNPHTAIGLGGKYIVKFEDDGDIERTVEPRMVLDMPKMTKLTKS
ncbi:hypothetical protein HDV00_011302 [Rhizophlyctis rosea]|nr:hypothetical protein HDV00_011302 [Rhizophlyctis rosea]